MGRPVVLVVQGSPWTTLAALEALASRAAVGGSLSAFAALSFHFNLQLHSRLCCRRAVPRVEGCALWFCVLLLVLTSFLAWCSRSCLALGFRALSVVALL